MTRNATVQYTKNLQLNDLNTKKAVKIIVTKKFPFRVIVI